MRQDILDEWNHHKGEMVLYNSRVYHLIGLGEDDMDYYWILHDGNKQLWGSCVCGMVWIKGKIDDRDYQNFIQVYRLNVLYCTKHDSSEHTKWKESYRDYISKEFSSYGRILYGPEFDPV